MKVLVIGGTGKVGSVLVQDLAQRGVDTRVLSRSAERAAALPKGVEPAVGDIVKDPYGAAAAFAGVDAVYMLNRPLPEEMVEGLLAVDLAVAAGVKRFVFQSIHRVEDITYIPHAAAKLAIEPAIKASGMEWTIIRPNNFFQNDLTLKMPILEKGLYTQPIGAIGTSSVDVGDIAQAAATAVLETGHAGKTYNIVGAEVLTGEKSAAVWSEVLGSNVRYVGNVEAWAAATRAVLPAWMHYDFTMMYKDFAVRGLLADQSDVDAVTQLLGRPPRSYKSYVTQLAAEWRA